ncbi:MAG TPA: SHD1 domain-containing protein [Rariglobus sp.]|jgi:hypothetical protein|nr:SHD1 domain-containing protein [Rariglobus sp.]
MKTTLLFILLLAFLFAVQPAHARTWTDTTGREVQATLVGFTAGTVSIRLAGGRVLQISRLKLSDDDKDFLAQCEKHRRTANRLSVHVIQSLDDGALCSVSKIVVVNVPTKKIKYATGLDGPTYETVNVPTETPVMVDAVAFVRGLTTVADDDDVDLILWTDGSYSYTSVGAGAKHVPAYTLNPPKSEVSIEAGDFGK